MSDEPLVFNPAPGWPTPPAGWVPPPAWKPDPSWPAPPAGWNFWLPASMTTAGRASVPAPGRPFLLWGTRGNWCNQEINGTEHRQSAIIGLMAGADLARGAAKEVTAQLVPEPANQHDPNAVSVQVEGKSVGYLPREIAPKYAAVLASMHYSGLIPSVPARIWAQTYDDYDEQLDGTHTVVRRYYTRVSIALAEPDQIQPINLAPPKPRAVLPVGTSVKITGTQQHFSHLDAVLAGRPLGWVYATLHRLDSAAPRSKKPVVEVRVNGRTAGSLTPQMSDTYLPLIDRLDRAGCTTVARVLLEGSPVSVVAAMHAVRPHELSAEWVNTATKQG